MLCHRWARRRPRFGSSEGALSNKASSISASNNAVQYLSGHLPPRHDSPAQDSTSQHSACLALPYRTGHRSCTARTAPLRFHQRHQLITVISLILRPACCCACFQMGGCGGALPTSCQRDSGVKGFIRDARRYATRSRGGWSRIHFSSNSDRSHNAREPPYRNRRARAATSRVCSSLLSLLQHALRRRKGTALAGR